MYTRGQHHSLEGRKVTKQFRLPMHHFYYVIDFYMKRYRMTSSVVVVFCFSLYLTLVEQLGNSIQAHAQDVIKRRC